MYKLLVTDLDGTLLNSEKIVSEKNIQAIKKAHEMGLTVVVATGRPPVGAVMPREALGENSGRYLITYNGALIQDTETGETIAAHTLKPEDVLRISAWAKENGFFCYCFNKDICLTPRLHPWSEHERILNNVEVKVVDFNDLDPDEEIYKIMVTGPAEALNRVHPKLPDALNSRYMHVRSTEELIEFQHLLASKGQAVKELAAALGIPRDQIICLGDAGNDEDMIRFAGMGVAMGNATEHVKSIADFVTRANDHHGVAYAIDHLLGRQVING